MNLKKGIPHLIAVAFFFLLTVVIYHPSFFNNQSISQHDIQQAVGASHQLEQHKENTGEEALWLHSMFSGMPAYLSGVNYSGDLLKYIHGAIMLGLKHPVGLTFVSLLAFYIMLLSFGIRPWMAIAGAVLFSLNGFNIISIVAGHNSKIAAVVYMPLVIAGIRTTYAGRRLLGLSLTAFALALQIRSNHPQITYYLLLIVLAYGLFELFNAISQKQIKGFVISSAGLLLAAFLALGANSGRLYNIYDYGKYSTRGKSEINNQENKDGLDLDYAFRFSNGITEPLFLFFPNVYGGASQQPLSDNSNVAEALKKNAGYSRMQINQAIQAMPTYWGDQPLTAPYYAGSILVFLIILAIVVLPKNQWIWLIAISLFGIALSWGKNFSSFNYFLFDYLPGYSKFRSVTFTIIIPIFCLNLLAFIGLEKWFSLDESARWPALKKSLMYLGGLLVVIFIVSLSINYRGQVDEQLPVWFSEALRDDRQSLFRMDILRCLIFCGLFSATLWAIVKKKINLNTGYLILIAVTLLDVLLLTRRFLNKDTFQDSPDESFFKATEADLALLDLEKPGERVLNLQNPWNEARTSYYHESIGGYHGAKLGRYQDMVDVHLNQEANTVIDKLRSGSTDFSESPALNMLNTKFFCFGPGKNNVIENPNAYGQAWVVSDLVHTSTPRESIDMISQVDLKTAAIVNNSEFTSSLKGGSGSIQLLEKTPNKLVYEAQMQRAGIGVFSEIYYPNGWTATIDGNTSNILRANYILRALEIPEGKHTIIFEFKPSSYYSLNTVMMISNILVVLILVIAIVIETKKTSVT